MKITKNDDIKKIKINNRIINTYNNLLLVSNTFNNFFINLGINLSNNIEKSTLTLYKEDAFSDSFNHSFTEIINESDVLKVLTNLKD